MKILGKILLTIIVLAVLVAALAYIDFFLMKKKDTFPTFAIKEENKEKEVVVYKGLFYKLWYCTYDETKTIGSYDDAEVICPRTYEYVNDYYTNNNGIKISKKDLQLMTYKNIFTYDMVELMSEESDVKNAAFVVYEYGKTIYNQFDNKTVKHNKETLKIVTFPDFVEEEGKYAWKYDDEETAIKYCLKEKDGVESFSLYENDKCNDTFEEKKLSNQWCTLAKNTSLVYQDNVINRLCSE